MYVADDESPHISRGARRSNALLMLFIAVGGAYGALVLAARLSPQIAASVPWHVLGMNGPELPFVTQLASAFAGLAALVMVLSRAVREVDKHPYASIAPVLAVFSGLLHSGLRVDLSAWGMSSTQLAVLVLALALLGGVLVGNVRLSARLFGWALVVVPPALVVTLIAGQPQAAASTPSALGMSSEHLFLVLLVGSSLLLGVAGVVARRLVGHARGPQPGGLDSLGWTGGDLNADMPVEYPGRRRFSGGGGGFTRSMQVSAAMILVAAGAYVAVDRLKHGASSEASNAGFASSPVGAPVVEQLDPAAVARQKEAAAALQKRQQRPGKQSAVRGAAASERLATAHQSSTPSKPVAPVKQASAPVAKARMASAQSASPSAKGLPAWGATATREVSNQKASSATSAKSAPVANAVPAASSKPSASKSSAGKPSAPISTEWGAMTAKPAPVAAAKPAPEPVAPRATAATSTSSGRNVMPPPFSRPVAPPPAAPPPKEENLTMDQLLNRVVGAARENRVAEGKGAKAPKNEKDNELEALLDEAMKGSSKPKKK